MRKFFSSIDAALPANGLAPLRKTFQSHGGRPDASIARTADRYVPESLDFEPFPCVIWDFLI